MAEWVHNDQMSCWELWGDDKVIGGITDELIASVPKHMWEDHLKPILVEIMPESLTGEPSWNPSFEMMEVEGFQSHVREVFGIQLPEEARPK